MPIWIIQVLESVVPAIVQLVVNAYMRKEQTPAVQAKLQMHQDILKVLGKT